MTRFCEAALPVPGLPDSWQQICPNPATRVHRYACAHEHVRVRATCDEHAPQPGVVGCRACWDAGHECEMRAELVELIEA